MAVRVLTIAGLDPCAGAGITADVRALQVLGAEVAAIPACLTVQNRHGFSRLEPVDPGWLQDAVEVVLADGPIHAVKIGLTGDAAAARAIAGAVARCGAPIVVDPVLSATSGGYQPGSVLVATIRDELLPRATVATPNRHELEALGGPERLVASCAVLATGGDDPDDDEVVDRLWTVAGVDEIRRPRIPRAMPIHGTGCALSTVLAFGLASGEPLADACRSAIDTVRRWIAATSDRGEGRAVPLRIVGYRGTSA